MVGIAPMMHDESMQEKVCIVTGATTGIGKATALALAKHGAIVGVVGRSAARATRVAADLAGDTGNTAIVPLTADLSSQRDVRALAREIRARFGRVHVLVNNAGALFSEHLTSVDGIEMTLALDHLSYFLLTTLLLDTLRAAGTEDAPARVVNVSSEAHRALPRLPLDDLQGARRWSPVRQYAVAKLANVMFTYELARRLATDHVTANVLHPGNVASNFARETTSGLLRFGFWIARPFLISPERGASTQVHLATARELAHITGRYFIRGRPRRSSRASYDVDAQRKLWEESELLVARAG